jgi:hypothetical protein
MKLRFLFTFLSMSTAASAGFVFPDLDRLSSREKEGLFRLLINPKHYSENEQALKADFRAAFPGKNIRVTWLPDTLQQAIETTLTTGLFNRGDVFVKGRAIGSASRN